VRLRPVEAALLEDADDGGIRSRAKLLELVPTDAVITTLSLAITLVTVAAKEAEVAEDPTETVAGTVTFPLELARFTVPPPVWFTRTEQVTAPGAVMVAGEQLTDTGTIGKAAKAANKKVISSRDIATYIFPCALLRLP
jgi:hypothetical protein